MSISNESNTGEVIPALQAVEERFSGWRSATVAADEARKEVLAALEAQRAAANTAKAGKRKRRRKAALIAVAAALGVSLVGAGAACAWLVNDDNERIQHVPATTVLDDAVDISGMTWDEAAAAVQNRADEGYSAQVHLKLGKKTYDIKLTKVGSVDVGETVAQAFAPYGETTQFERCMQRVKEFFGETFEGDYHVTTVNDVVTKKLKKAIHKIAEKINRSPVDAEYTYDYDLGRLVAIYPENGRQVNEKKTLNAVKKALKGTLGSVSAKGVVDTVEPDDSYLGQAIFVDTYGCELMFYEDGDIVYDWPCSPGQPGYSTPSGDWYLEYKDGAPTWTNPGSDWAKGMPDEIGPGASNPLGLRALAVSCGGGIFIHGTTNYGELGSQASHGCIRLANENIVTLYNVAETGIPIVIR